MDSKYWDELLNNSIELKRCPFCGSKARFITTFYKNSLGYGRYSVTYSVGIKCTECTLAQISPYQDTVWLEEIENAYMKRAKVFAERWNRRANDDTANLV